MGTATNSSSCTLTFYRSFENELYDLINLPSYYIHWAAFQTFMVLAIFSPPLASTAEFFKYQYLMWRNMNEAMAFARYSDQEWWNVFNFGGGFYPGEWWCIMWQSFFLSFHWLYFLLIWDKEWTDVFGWLRDFIY